MHLQRYPKTHSTSLNLTSSGVGIHHRNNINTQGKNTYRMATPIVNDTTPWLRHNGWQFQDIGATLHFYVLEYLLHLEVQVWGVVSVLDVGCPGDALDCPPLTQ
jgi:hypothetical protein